MAPERGRKFKSLVERQDHLLSPPLQDPGRKLFEDFEVLADEGGGARDVAGRRRIQLLQDGQDFETDALRAYLPVRFVGSVR